MSHMLLKNAIYITIAVRCAKVLHLSQIRNDIWQNLGLYVSVYILMYIQLHGVYSFLMPFKYTGVMLLSSQIHQTTDQYRGILVDVLHQNGVSQASNRRPIYPYIGRWLICDISLQRQHHDRIPSFVSSLGTHNYKKQDAIRKKKNR